MPKHQSTINSQDDSGEDRRKITEIILSNAPKGISERDALVLFDLCFHTAGVVGTKHGLASDHVRKIKMNNKDVFNALQSHRFQISRRYLEGSVYDGIQLVSKALSQMDPKDLNTPNKVAQFINALNGAQALAEKINPDEATNADKSAIAKGLEGIQAIKAAREDK